MARAELTISDIEDIAKSYSEKSGVKLYVRPNESMMAIELTGLANGIYVSRMITRLELFEARSPRAVVLSYMDAIKDAILRETVKQSVPNFMSTFTSISSTSISAFPMFQLKRDLNLEALALRQDYDVMMERVPERKTKAKAKGESKQKFVLPPTGRVIDLGD